MRHKTPIGPWQNPKIEPGLHDAEVSSADVRITLLINGRRHQTLRLVFRLDDDPRPFTTQTYLPAQRSFGAERRLIYLCAAAGVDHADIVNHPERFVGKRLRLDIRPVHPDDVKFPDGYMDVERFLRCPPPPPPPLAEPPKPEVNPRRYRRVLIE